MKYKKRLFILDSRFSYLSSCVLDFSEASIKIIVSQVYKQSYSKLKYIQKICTNCLSSRLQTFEAYNQTTIQ